MISELSSLTIPVLKFMTRSTRKMVSEATLKTSQVVVVCSEKKESIHKLRRYFHVNHMPHKELDVTDSFVDDGFGATRAESSSDIRAAELQSIVLHPQARSGLRTTDSSAAQRHRDARAVLARHAASVEKPGTVVTISRAKGHRRGDRGQATRAAAAAASVL
ncbi:hypothetical protein EYF80_004324 [Liparis tanakae]|uniref:Uncharacterized protein n=1 Tax=Liparis tanakae TaxID=230148 RepID=A0A4Z2J781_9TELE|nr:hypothetical protein EYF80_004324 [Liparis tanakae]